MGYGETRGRAREGGIGVRECRVRARECVRRAGDLCALPLAAKRAVPSGSVWAVVQQTLRVCGHGKLSSDYDDHTWVWTAMAQNRLARRRTNAEIPGGRGGVGVGGAGGRWTGREGADGAGARTVRCVEEPAGGVTTTLRPRHCMCLQKSTSSLVYEIVLGSSADCAPVLHSCAAAPQHLPRVRRVAPQCAAAG